MRSLGITSDATHNGYAGRARVGDASLTKMSTGNQTLSPKGETGSVPGVMTPKFNFGRLRSLYAHLNVAAKSLRVADTAMQKIGGLIEQMQTQLEGIIKSYPPFPQGSEERVKYLESYTGLRMQIDQLTIPPDNEGARKILADPRTVPEAGDWEMSLGVEGARGVIRSQQVHSGPEGLDIPELPGEATDEQIYAALEKLGSSQEALESKRKMLAEDAQNLKRMKDFESTVAKRNPSYGEEMKAAEREEMIAESMSSEVKYALSGQPGLQLTGTETNLTNLLN